MARRQSDRLLPLIEAVSRRQYAVNAGATLAQLRCVDPADNRVHPNLPGFVEPEHEGIERLLRAELADATASEREGLVRQFVVGTQACMLGRGPRPSLALEGLIRRYPSPAARRRWPRRSRTAAPPRGGI